MTNRLFIALALLLSALVGRLSATGPDQFRPAGVLAFDEVVDAALAGGRLYVLGHGALTIYDANAPGPEYRKLETLSVGREFVELAASGDQLVLCSRLGAVALYAIENDRLSLRSEFQAPDSIKATTLFQGTLGVAHGYSGVSLYDVRELTHPVLWAQLTEPDYAVGLGLSASCLYVLDELNGVQVYRLNMGQPVFLAEIPSDKPVIDIAADRDGVAFCDGSSIVTYWHCDAQTGVVLDHTHDFEFSVSRLAADPLRSYRILAGSPHGELALYDPEAEVVVALTRVAAPVADLFVAEGPTSYPYVAILETGALIALEGVQPFLNRKEIRSDERPQSVVATQGGAVISTARGLEELRVQDGNVISSSLVAAAPIFSYLQTNDETIVGGIAGEGAVHCFQRTTGATELSDQIDNFQDLVDMRVSRRGDGSVGLYLFGRSSVQERDLFPDGTTALDYDYPWPAEIAVAAVSATLLMGASEEGRLVVYEKDRSQAQRLLEAQIASRPRDLEIINESVLAVASPAGLDLYQIDRLNHSLSPLDSPPAIYAPFGLEYDEPTKILFVADGYAGVKYLDMSDPANLALAYSIEGTAGATSLTHFDNTLYCVSSGWLKVFERKVSSESHSTNYEAIASLDAFPNPFNSTSAITLTLNDSAPLPTVVNLALLNILGQTLAEVRLPVSTREIRIALADLSGEILNYPSGIYFLRAGAGGRPVTRKLVLLK